MCLLTIGLTKRRPPKGKVNPSVLLAHQSTQSTLLLAPSDIVFMVLVPIFHYEFLSSHDWTEGEQVS